MDDVGERPTHQIRSFRPHLSSAPSIQLAQQTCSPNVLVMIYRFSWDALYYVLLVFCLLVEFLHDGENERGRFETEIMTMARNLGCATDFKVFTFSKRCISGIYFQEWWIYLIGLLLPKYILPVHFQDISIFVFLKTWKAFPGILALNIKLAFWREPSAALGTILSVYRELDGEAKFLITKLILVHQLVKETPVLWVIPPYTYCTILRRYPDRLCVVVVWTTLGDFTGESLRWVASLPVNEDSALVATLWVIE